MEKFKLGITLETDTLNRNLVLNGSFRPNEIDKYFFITNGLISESEFNLLPVPPSFNDFEALISTEKYKIVLNPVQLVVFSNSLKHKDDNLGEFVFKLISCIKHPKITSFGINFDYSVDLKDEKNVQRISRLLFYKEESRFLNSFFSEEDSHFGFYASKNFHGSRLKLDIRPIEQIITQTNVIKFNGLLVKFNFHFNQANTNFIKEYNVYMEKSFQIINFFQNFK